MDRETRPTRCFCFDPGLLCYDMQVGKVVLQACEATHMPLLLEDPRRSVGVLIRVGFGAWMRL